MDDAEMVDYLLRCALGPDQPRPSIETLLHAFVAATHVDHTHPDAVIALTSSPDGRRLAEEAFGAEAVWLDYQRPGFSMAKRVAELLEANPGARAVLLEKHGLVTWGETSAESYAATLEVVRRAAEAIGQAAGSRFGLGGPGGPQLDDQDADELLAAALPALRGALLADSPGVVLLVDRSPEAVAFATATRTPEVSQIGAPCPDHLIHTKHKPLVARFDPSQDGRDELRAAFRDGVAEYSAWYRRVLRAQSRRREPAVPDRSARAARRDRPRNRHRHERRQMPAGPGLRAISTTARSPCRTRPTRSAGSAH